MKTWKVWAWVAAGAAALAAVAASGSARVSGVTLKPKTPRRPGKSRREAGASSSSAPGLGSTKEAEVVCPEPPPSESIDLPRNNAWGIPYGHKPGCLIRISRAGVPSTIAEYGGAARAIAAMRPFERETAGAMRDGAWVIDPPLPSRPVMPGRLSFEGDQRSVSFGDREILYAGYILYRSVTDEFSGWLDFSATRVTRWWLVALWDPGRCEFTLWKLTNADA